MSVFNGSKVLSYRKCCRGLDLLIPNALKSAPGWDVLRNLYKVTIYKADLGSWKPKMGWGGKPTVRPLK